MQLRLAFACQRWRARRDLYRPAGEPIDPSRYGVEPILERHARAFVVREHYSASMCAARASVGLLEVGRGLVGVAVFAVPMNPRTLQAYAPGTAPSAGVELGRLVLLDDVPANGETFFVARAFRALRALLPEVEVVLSFSDPFPRSRSDGSIVMPGHVGTVYQAAAARYVGRSSPRTMLLAGDGRAVAPRALSKLRNGERGGQRGGYVHRQLLSMGAPAWSAGESGEAYARRILASGVFRAVRHPGNHAYLWPLGGRGRRLHVARRFPPPLPYPKKRPAI